MLKQSYLYQVYKNSKAVIVLTAVYAAFILLDIISCIFFGDAETVISGWDFGVLIFTFVLGCSTFGEDFPMHLQNSVSRKTFFTAKVLAELTLSAMVSIMCMAFTLASNALSKLFSFNYSYIGLYEEMYFRGNAESFVQYLQVFCALLAGSAMVYMLGTLISCFFYRANKAVRVAVCVGVPVLLCVVLPIVDMMHFDFAIFPKVFNVVCKAFGITNGLPWLGASTPLILFAVISAVTWLAVRRAPLKTK